MSYRPGSSSESSARGSSSRFSGGHKPKVPAKPTRGLRESGSISSYRSSATSTLSPSLVALEAQQIRKSLHNGNAPHNNYASKSQIGSGLLGATTASTHQSSQAYAAHQAAASNAHKLETVSSHSTPLAQTQKYTAPQQTGTTTAGSRVSAQSDVNGQAQLQQHRGQQPQQSSNSVTGGTSAVEPASYTNQEYSSSLSTHIPDVVNGSSLYNSANSYNNPYNNPNHPVYQRTGGERPGRSFRGGQGAMVSDSNAQQVPHTNMARDVVGFATLPNQIHKKAVRRGFEFTLMVCGESGLGKSTLLNSLFLTDIYSDQYPGPSRRSVKTLSVHETDVKIHENGVNLTLTVVDTPGYGDSINNTSAWNQVNEFIEQKFENFLNDESRVMRQARPCDRRVHACLYFIAPSGHGMKALDIEFMKRLHDKVNIIPVIAKADAMTPEEIKSFKAIIRQQIAENMISTYNFPDLDNDGDNRKITSRLPFAVIGSNYVLEVNQKRLRARQYPWGFAEIENADHCDFGLLREMLLRSHMQDLIDVTATYHYENYRQRKLSPVISNMNPDGSSGQGSLSGDNYEQMQVDKNPIEQIEEERRNHKLRMRQMETEMEQVFQLKVQEKRKRLKESEQELQRRHEQMKEKMEKEWEALKDRRQQFEHQRQEWEEQNKSTLAKLDKAKTRGGIFK